MVNQNPQTPPKAQTPGRVMFLDGQGELPMIGISTIWSSAEVYLQGAHLTTFRKHGETPLTFMSQCSRFSEGHAIRGGIPVVFPWFGMREGMGNHGFARVKTWELKEFAPAPDGSVSVRFRLPDCPEASSYPPFTADYVITVSESLTLQLIVTNQSQDEPLAFENCFHTYFNVGDVTAISILGLQNASFLDKVANFAHRTQTEDVLRVSSEVDRIYLNTSATVEIQDPRLGRKIRIEKQGSASTVVWNPWIAKSQQMPDFGNDEYQRMLCIESGNVASNELTVAPGRSSTLTVRLSSELLP
ncbi:MAG TPA: D-hexose-6-phosphate mutarotase [Verrucomicrobiae bacterium]|nr:D-hexose-6-phosphate mutarotase [Verrucomicrobiae bacterium]